MKKTAYFEKALWCSKSELPLKRKGHSFFVRGSEKPRLADCEGILVDKYAFQKHESVKGKVNLFYSKTPFPEYERNEDIGTLLSKSRDRVFADLLNRSIPFHSKVLEVGCGTGQLGNFLAISGREILSVDMCLNSLRLAENFRSEQKISSIKFMQGDLFDLALRKKYFDVVICTGVLHHTSDPKKGFENFLKYLRPNGIIIVGLYNKIMRLPLILKKPLFKIFKEKAAFLDPYLKRYKISGKKKTAWINDQYLHPHESTHTIDEVLMWFQTHNVQFIR